MDTYKLKVTNNSLSPMVFAIYQKAPQNTINQIYTLAWLCAYAAKGVTVNFTWQLEYNAIWSQPGKHLQNGVICDCSQTKLKSAVTSSQIINIDVNDSNTVSLSYLKTYNTYSFGNAESKTEGKNTIYTNCDASVPNSIAAPASSVAAIGIGMSGSGTFITGTQTNKEFEWLIPSQPKYYLIAGNFNKGEILDINNIKNNALDISYNGVLSRSAILNSNNVLEVAD